MCKLLIINADDYGRSTDICRGILDAFHNGVVTSTTVMANYVSEEDINELKNSNLPAGIHMNLTSGSPIAVWNKIFLDKNGCFSKKTVENLPREMIEEELEAQWDFLTSRGIKPTHLDSHHHVHAQALVLSVVTAFALKRGIPVRPCDQSVMLHLQRMNIAAPACFSSAFYGRNKLSVERFLEIVDKSDGESLEIMCHPGYSSPELRSSSTYADERELELSILKDASLRKELVGRGVIFGSYKDL